MKFFLVSLALAFGMAMVGCLIANAAEKPLRTLSKGAFSGISEAKQEIIKDQEAWEKFWAKHNVAMKPSAQLPKVDFSKEMVIAVTLGKKTSGGYSIEIMAVEPTASALKIFIKRTSPAPGAIVITALTAPFHFVAVPKSDLKPQFADAKDDGKK